MNRLKKIVVAILISAIYSYAYTQDMKGMDMNKKVDTKQIQSATYTCPMHPEIHAAKPGNCPKCGMKLIKEKPKAVAKPAVKKQEQVQMPAKDSSGKSIGMQMNSAETKKAIPAATYTCVMHPEIHAAKPGNCPKCGMKLVKEKPAAGKDDMQMQDKDSSGKASDMDGMQMNNSTEMPMKKVVGNPTKTIANNTPPRTVRYDLYVANTMVNYTGKMKMAMAINGSIPGPVLSFTEGDTAEIYVHNTMKMETSIHWHGLILPNQYDGVPYLTTQPIKGGATHLFRFPIVQNGTYWYHSHTMLQEQSGLYGAIVINKRAEPDIKQLTLLLSDWTDMNPDEVNRSLHNQTDWFGIRKNTIQSYSEAIKSGHFKTKITNEWKRMTAMDVSDIAYDKFLINGKENSEQPQYKASDRVKLRVINGGASSYFWLKYAGGKMTVVASDGEDVVPVEVDRLIIAVAETYDVIVTIPDNMSYEFLVTPEDRTKSASVWLGSGMKMPAGNLPKLKYFAGMKMMNDMMDMNGNMMQMGSMKMQNQQMDMNTVMYPEITGIENPDDTIAGKKQEMETPANNISEDGKMNMGGEPMQMSKAKPISPDHSGHNIAGMDMAEGEETDIVTLNYNMLRAPKKTTLPAWPMRTMEFELTGNMNRYVWSINNKVLSETDNIMIKKGENIRMILYNNTMMRHPMHLHGHFFRILNGQGEYAPLKNVLDIMPMERDTIEFAGTESGDWIFHCHILYHMMSGMGRVFRYENSPPNPEIPEPKYARKKLLADDRKLYPMARIGLESSGTEGEAILGNTRWKASTTWHLGTSTKRGYESETMIGRYLGRMQWWYPYAGFDYHYKKFNPKEKNMFGSDEKNMFGQASNKERRQTVVAGVAYTLPMLVIADARIDGNGKYRFQLSREDIPVSPRIRFNWMLNTDKEYAAGLLYSLSKYFNLSTHYDSDMGLGAGITITY